MHCTPTPNTAELKKLLEPVLKVQDLRIETTDQELLNGTLMDQLAYNCLEASPEVSLESQKAVWKICQFMGTPYTHCTDLIRCITRDGISDMIIPIVDANWIPFELLCIILAAGKEMEVGPLVFSVDRKSPDSKHIIYQILCAAIKTNWHAPVLFHDGVEALPVETVNLDWKKMLYFNSYELPTEPLETLMGKLLRQKFEDLTEVHWKQLMNIPDENWIPLSDEIYDVYCDLFEELDINETFLLLKRYVIPKWVKEDILETE